MTTISTPTKADPLYERMLHAFGRDRIRRNFENMVSAHGSDLLDYLTDEARDELIRRCITGHKLARKFNADNRRRHRERVRA